ncbi:hypothetical protein ACHAQD_003382 [Fusarium lateritium]
MGMDLQQLIEIYWPLLRELKQVLKLFKKVCSNLDADDREWIRQDWSEIFDIATSVQEQFTSVRKLYHNKSVQQMKDLVMIMKTEIDTWRHGCPQVSDVSDSEPVDSEPVDSEPDDSGFDDPESPTKRLKLAEDDDRSTKKGDRLKRQPRTTRTTRKVRIVLRTKTNTNHRPLLWRDDDESNQTPRILPDDPSPRSNAQSFSSNAQAFSSNAQAFSSNDQAFSNSGQQERSRPRGLIGDIMEKNQKKADMDQEMKDS